MTGGVEGSGGQGGAYNGGLENYPRLHENWSGVSLTYRGSFVSLGPPDHVVGPHTTPLLYSPPVRNWGYDVAKTEFGAVDKDGGPWLSFENPVTGREIVIKDVIADAFLQQMVRSIVAALIRIGMGRATAEDLQRELRSRYLLAYQSSNVTDKRREFSQGGDLWRGWDPGRKIGVSLGLNFF